MHRLSSVGTGYLSLNAKGVGMGFIVCLIWLALVVWQGSLLIGTYPLKEFANRIQRSLTNVPEIENLPVLEIDEDEEHRISVSLAAERKKRWFGVRLAVLSVPFGFAMFCYVMHTLHPPPTAFRDQPGILQQEIEFEKQLKAQQEKELAEKAAEQLAAQELLDRMDQQEVDIERREHIRKVRSKLDTVPKIEKYTDLMKSSLKKVADGTMTTEEHLRLMKDVDERVLSGEFFGARPRPRTPRTPYER